MSTKSERIEVRLSKEHKELIEKAAALRGQSISAFVVSEALECAYRSEAVHLTRRDWSRFLEIMDRDEEPAPALVDAARRSRTRD